MPKISVVTGLRGREHYLAHWQLWNDADEVIPALDDYLGKRYECVTSFNRAVAIATGDIIIFCGERLRVAPTWREVIEEQYKDGWSGVVSFFDHTPGGGAIDRKYLEEIGGHILHPDYIHYYADVELGERARRNDRYIEKREILTDHLGKGDSMSEQLREFDKQTLDLRTKAGWPNESVLNPDDRTRILETLVWQKSQ